MTRKEQKMLLRLASEHEAQGSWSTLVRRGVFTEEQVEQIDRFDGDAYFHYGVLPRVLKNGPSMYARKMKMTGLDALTLIRRLYGVNKLRAYRYCNYITRHHPFPDYEDLFKMPLSYVECDAGRQKSSYAKGGGSTRSDCSVRTFSRITGSGYDPMLGLISNIVDYNPATQGLQESHTSAVCKQFGLKFCVSSMLPYSTACELYGAFPELNQLTIGVLVYKHIFCIDKGVVYDCRGDESPDIHEYITGVIYKQENADMVESMFKNHNYIAPDVKYVAYQRWAHLTSWRNLGIDLRTDHAGMLSEIWQYLSEVRALAYNWYTKDEFKQWVLNYTPQKLCNRMGISLGDAKFLYYQFQQVAGVA